MKLEASKRNATGKARALRNQGMLPAVVYNKGINIPISIDLKAFDRTFRQQGTSHVIDLDVDGENHEVLVKAVQMDKRRRIPMHVDFYEITAGQVVDVSIPIDLQGTPSGVRDGGMLDIKRREVNISILPRLIPDGVAIDIRNLNIGDSLHISDLVEKLPSEATVLDDIELTVVTIVPPRLAASSEEEGLEDDIVEPEVIAKGKDDEDEDA